MATGIFGTKRSADFRVQDCEIYYTYSPDRGTATSEVLSLNPTQVLQKLDDPSDSGLILGGLYNLTLPTTVFNKKGIFNIIIRPKRLRVRISDCGVLSSKPDIRGLLFDLSSISSDDISKFENGGLIGYRVEYVSTTATEERKVQKAWHCAQESGVRSGAGENPTQAYDLLAATSCTILQWTAAFLRRPARA